MKTWCGLCSAHGICAFIGSGYSFAVPPWNGNWLIFGHQYPPSLVCVVWNLLPSLQVWLGWDPTSPLASKMQQVSAWTSGMGEKAAPGSSWSNQNESQDESRWLQKETVSSFTLNMDGGEWPWGYSGHKMTPENVANTGKDRPQSQERLSWQFLLSSWIMFEARFPLDF